MDLEQVVQNRFSCRKFLRKPVPKELLEKLVKLCQRAPSAGNLQAFRDVIVTDPEIKQRLAYAANGQDFIAEAPIVFVISAAPTLSEWRYRERGRNLYAIQDATIFAAYCELISTNFGLASVWVGAFSESQVTDIIQKKVPSSFIEKPIALIAIGYCSEEPFRFTSRISTSELVYRLD